ncbi:MAG: EAL domain-containing protein, partial [Betaproteobacteria bacterium]|nr:EAL domain-containing protein [Betaproteobacteria bacterium]
EQHTQQLTLQLRHLETLYEDEIVARWKVTNEWRHEKAFSEATIESLPGTFFMLDRNGAVTHWNQRFAQMTGLPESEIRGQPAWNFVIDKDVLPLQEWVSRILASDEALTLEAELSTRHNTHIPHLLQGRTVVIKCIPYCIVVGRDISERRQVEMEIRRAKQRLDLALAGSNLVMWDWDLVTDKVYFSENWHTVLGVKPAAKTNDSKEVLGWNHPDDTQRFQANMILAIKGSGNHLDCEYRIPGLNGEWVWIHTRGKVTERDAQGRARRMTGTSVNVTKRKMAEERVEFLATRDPLTGLPNRMLANDRLEQGIIQAARKRSRLAFMFIDLDRFKTINDSLGHDVGDELLKRVAARLLACVRASDTVARLGGDEFAVIVENLPNEEHGGAQNVAEKMIASLASPVMINGQHLNTSCSIGISLFPNDGSDTQTLMKHADVAMYDAKARGRNNYQFFSHEMNAHAQERHSIENFLRLALRRNELTLHYQPRISFTTGQITAVEALLRWQHPRYGLLLPEKFLGIAEDAGLTTPIGEWIIQSAFTQVSAWQKQAGFPLKLALNIASSQIFDGQRLIRTIDLAAQSTGLDLHRVELELTESTLIKNGTDIAALLNSLTDRGIRLSIDDFGVGYSSLSSLKQLPIKSIKVDPSFVRDIGTDPNDEAVIRAIIAMSHSLKIDVIAEGVENEEQYRVLRDLQCDEYQGYFYTKPLPAAEFEARLRHSGTSDY